jgi:hypothetical protein
VKRLGDALWYIALTAHVAGVGLDGVARANVERVMKLHRRHDGSAR